MQAYLELCFLPPTILLASLTCVTSYEAAGTSCNQIFGGCPYQKALNKLVIVKYYSSKKMK